MEVDMHSPSFRTLRVDNTLKRSRSPDTPSPLDRPSKRISLCVSHEPYAHPHAYDAPPYPSASPSNGPPHNSGHGNGNGREEGWVVQTRSLTLDVAPGPMSFGASPHAGPSSAPPPPADTDEHMNLDDAPPAPHVPAIHISTSPPQHPSALPPFAHPAHFLSAPPPLPTPPLPTPPLPGALHAHAHPPRINIQPASPHSPQAQNAQWAAPVPMQQDAAPGPQRRPRVMMGPRADCEKCRLGVKGHWMHFD